VQVSRSAEPRQQGGVLDRIPCPEAPPPEHLVRPPSAHDDADREEGPGDEGVAAGFYEPAFAEATGHEGGDGEGERDREADETHVEKDRVEGDEDVVLQQRVRPEAGCRDRAGDRHEGVGRSGHEPEEECRNDESHEQCPGDERIRRPAPEAARHHGDVAREHERPQEDGSLQCRPHPRDGVEERSDAGVVVEDVGEREVVGDESVLHGGGRQEGAGKHAPGRQRSRLEPDRTVLGDADRKDADAADRRNKAEGDADLPENGVHGLEPEVGFTRFG
jgi:hypothetical protein